ncbi:katanin p80 WD40 repeat-containing subunit B1-like [Rhopilema esculentum]|uniref:katanin p80 WD40 repeat-containing subunit B1-like n=1 Tax=Rhopilema esculentum TaxID=499914 RepID=UPI0031D7B26C
MANQGKRVWKLQENVAHSSQVTCLALGPSSGRVIVTGGEDRKVNMWAVGKPNVIMSLSGHTAPVESVQFNNSEELVLAGSQSGTLKIWDLEAAKIVRTLTGHKSSIKCLDFHPYGDFVASGSSDTNLKLWDVKRKGCIFTYKGHTDSVNHLRFSPDGRWIISAGQDGVAKLWDLTAGKILNDFKDHTSAVNKIEFHPKEFLLATASADRTVKFWDLETFDLISTTELEQSSVRAISFHPEGHCLFSGSQDSLRVYGWEPKVCYDSFSLGWGKVSDMVFSSNQMIGASFAQTNMSVWVIDLAHLPESISDADKREQTLKKEKGPEEAVNPAGGGNAPVPNASRKQSPQRKSFNTRPRTTSSKPKPTVKEETPAAVVEDDDQPVTYDKAFKPSAVLRRSPSSERRLIEPFKAPDEQIKSADPVVSESRKDDNEKGKPESRGKISPEGEKGKEQPPNVEVASHEPAPQPQIQNVVAAKVETKESRAPSRQPPSPDPTPQAPSNPQWREKANIDPRPVHPSSAQPPFQQNSEKARPESEVAGVNLNDFMPVISKIGQDVRNDPPSHHISDEAAMGLLRKSHQSICTIMTSRLKNLSIIGQMWTDGEIKSAVQTAASMPDQAILIDLLNVLVLKQTLWNLDICVVVLPQVKEMLSSKYESYVETGCSVIRLVLKSFAPVIKSNMAAPPVSVGCDIVREERYQKCRRCHSYLMDIKELANRLSHNHGKHGAMNKQISLALNAID